MEIPEIVLDAAECGAGKIFNHAKILCTKEQQDEVKALFEKTYTSMIMRDMVKRCWNGGAVGLYIDPEELYVEVHDKGDYDEAEDEDSAYLKRGVWSFDPKDISNYGFEITSSKDGLFITFPPQNFMNTSGDKFMGGTSAVENTLMAIKEKIPTVKYYGYEGCYACGNAYCQEYFSDKSQKRKSYKYVGQVLSELWGNDDFWEAFDEAIEDIDEEIATEIVEMVNTCKKYLGDSPIQVLLDHISDEEIADMIEEIADEMDEDE